MTIFRHLFISTLSLLSLIHPSTAIHSFCPTLSVPPLDPSGLKCKDETYASADPNGCCRDPTTNQVTWAETFCSGRRTDGNGNCEYTDCDETYLPHDRSVDERFLDTHNYFRCLHEHLPLAWSASLAAQASEYAGECVFEHSSQVGLDGYGENLAIGYNTPEESVEAWYNEFSDPGYQPGTKFESGVGHYTALIWKSTSKLGCGFCAASKIDVCQYQDNVPNLNTVEQYVANVPQTTVAPDSAREAYCCDVVYGGTPSPSNAPSVSPDETPSDSPSAMQVAPSKTSILIGFLSMLLLIHPRL